MWLYLVSHIVKVPFFPLCVQLGSGWVFPRRFASAVPHDFTTMQTVRRFVSKRAQSLQMLVRQSKRNTNNFWQLLSWLF